MDIIYGLADFILHINHHLTAFTATHNNLIYLLLFAIVFAETGLIVAPFLPGDSLLLAAGALAAKPESGISVYLLIVLLIIAAIIGDYVNYSVGKTFGNILLKKNFRFIKQSYLDDTAQFYKKHGDKTVVFARFFPIIRTFAPFIAGIGKMPGSSFLTYNVLGGVVWVLSFVLAGFFFGNIPAVKNNFIIVIIGVIFISLIPIFYTIIKTKMSKAN